MSHYHQLMMEGQYVLASWERPTDVNSKARVVVPPAYDADVVKWLENVKALKEQQDDDNQPDDNDNTPEPPKNANGTKKPDAPKEGDAKREAKDDTREQEERKHRELQAELVESSYYFKQGRETPQDRSHPGVSGSIVDNSGGRSNSNGGVSGSNSSAGLSGMGRGTVDSPNPSSTYEPTPAEKIRMERARLIQIQRERAIQRQIRWENQVRQQMQMEAEMNRRWQEAARHQGGGSGGGGWRWRRRRRGRWRRWRRGRWWKGGTPKRTGQRARGKRS